MVRSYFSGRCAVCMLEGRIEVIKMEPHPNWTAEGVFDIPEWWGNSASSFLKPLWICNLFRLWRCGKSSSPLAASAKKSNFSTSRYRIEISYFLMCILWWVIWYFIDISVGKKHDPIQVGIIHAIVRMTRMPHVRFAASAFIIIDVLHHSGAGDPG